MLGPKASQLLHKKVGVCVGVSSIDLPFAHLL